MKKMNVIKKVLVFAMILSMLFTTASVAAEKEDSSVMLANAEQTAWEYMAE